ncbi:UbiA family prenyltransferase [Nakamurella flavida]|uniref:UbiA family prenyltransferase n=1 Tax=Nakamurella flavida TaxID=363630 RepID=A0A938YNX9_9ACTN|nr:UbiA family prenyltransferase [Nakamurella flavida]MBM9476704.1 UbiA family prenyltransferase [Nakamurella flavida]MDP9778858.1 4-hydroxybenzoate polyprenyltransferase/chlorophyll synthase [Nakamurella flavida]
MQPISPFPTLVSVPPVPLRTVGVGRGARVAATAWTLFLEARPAVQLVFLQRILVTSGFLVVPHPDAGRLLLGWPMLAVAVYVFNGVCDQDEDRVNGSGRPLAQGRIGIRVAGISCAATGLGGLLLCGWSGPGPLLLAVASLALGWAYSAGPRWKDGAVSSALSVGAGALLTYAAGWLVYGGPHPVLMLGALLAVWVTCCCPTKDLSDREGDALAGRRTLPVLLGPVRTGWVLGVVALVAGGLVAAAVLVLAPVFLPVAVVVVVGSVLVAVALPAASRATDRVGRRRPYLMFLSCQLAINVAAVAVMV